MMKKLLALLLTLTLVLSLAACGGEKPAPETDDETELEDTVSPDGEDAETPDGEDAEIEDAEDPEAGMEEPAETPEVKPEPKPETKPEPKPETKPEVKPEEKPAKTVDLTAFYGAFEQLLTEKYGEDGAPVLAEMNDEMLDAFYPGLTGVSAKQVLVAGPMISAVVSEIALVEVQNSADVQKVKDIFQTRINTQVGDDANPGAAMYPASIEGWKTGSRIVSNGNYVMMIVIECADDVVSLFNSQFA